MALHKQLKCQHWLNNNRNYLFYAAILTILFGAVEALCGWWYGSLTLLSDAGHMGIDALVLLLAALASWMARRPTTAKHTYGFGRIEVIVSWFSSLLLIFLVIAILIEAVHRLRTSHTIPGAPIIIVALIGLGINTLVAWILHKGEKTLNTKAALLHVLSDLLGSIAVLISGIIIYFTNWTKIDAILSIFICALMLTATVRLLYEALSILMESVPKNISLNEVTLVMQNIYGVAEIHDLHIWTLTSGTIILTAHVVTTDTKHWPEIMDNLHDIIKKNFGIKHITLQIETPDRKSAYIDCDPNN